MASRGRPYHEDSDADDEFERSIMTSPERSHTDSETSSDAPMPPEHTPTFDPSLETGERPRTIVSAWTSDECAQFVVSLGLRQYAELFIEQGIDGEVLIALTHEELKEMGIASVGHRLKLLKEVYTLKIAQDVPVGVDDFRPKTAEEDDQHEMATKEDFHKLARTIVKLRDERILELEAQVTRLADDARKLRTELWPLFKMVKEKEPLPYRPHDMSGLPVDYTDSAAFSSATTAEAKEPKTSLTRTFSKKLGLSSGNNKNHSPTHLPNSIPENRAAYEPLGLQPSAAANAASSSLTASMTGGNGPILPTSNAPSLPSPTSPVPYHQHLPPRSFTYSNATFDSERDTFRTGSVPPQMMSSSLHSISTNANNLPDPPKSGSTKTTFSNASTLIPPREMSASVPPQLNPSTNSRATPSSNTNAAVNSTTADTSRGEKDPTVEIFKSFRVALDDPCHKVLPAALRKYNINADWRQYALYIVYGDQERCVGLEEKPLALFKDLDREGKKPMFMLRKWAGGPPTGGSQTNPAFAGFEPSSGGGIKTAGLTNPMSSGLAEARNPRPPAGGVIPGGLL